MAFIVYALCALTCIVCAGVLMRAYWRSRTVLLLLCSVCFIGLTLNNIALFVDLVIIPEGDLSMLRIVPAFLGLTILLGGLIWETV